MTAAQLSGRDSRTAGRILHGLTWTVQRTHRTSLVVWSVFVLGGATGLIWLQRFGEDTQTRFGGPCGGQGMRVCDFGFPYEIDAYLGRLGLAAGILAWISPVVAAFAAGLLVGRELENGTASLAWTQSVSPARWLAAKLTLPALLLTAGFGLLTILFRWVWVSGDSAWKNPWYTEDVYHATGPVDTAYVVLALVVGVLSALVVRRALPAAVVAAVGSLLMLAAGNAVRGVLWPKTLLTGLDVGRYTNNSIVYDVGTMMNSGARVNATPCFDYERADQYRQCLGTTGAKDVYAVAHPPWDYWPLQLVESALVLAVAAGLVWCAFRLLRRRVAV